MASVGVWDVAGLAVSEDRSWHVASVRTFPTGALLADVAGLLGVPPPKALQAATDGADAVLAWRSPTEAWLLCRASDRFARIIETVGDREDGCVIDQTGGLAVWRIVGARGPDLLARLGSVGSIAARGEARVGRFAELTAMSICVRAGEWMLVADRVYAAHLTGWIEGIVADLSAMS